MPVGEFTCFLTLKACCKLEVSWAFYFVSEPRHIPFYDVGARTQKLWTQILLETRGFQLGINSVVVAKRRLIYTLFLVPR